MICGDVYESSTGIFYVYTPSQYSNTHQWMIMSPNDILDLYGDMLSEDEKEYLVKSGNIHVE